MIDEIRSLTRLASAGACLLPQRRGSDYAVFAKGDRRRRPLAKLGKTDVRRLESEGVIEARAEGFVLSRAGRARLKRAIAAPGEAYAAQQGSLVDRAVVTRGGAMRSARGYDSNATLRRLSKLTDTDGSPWLSADELGAATRLRDDWEFGEIGLMRGSDWTAPPLGSSARGGNARENLITAQCDARRRAAEALDQLAPALRRVVERVCLYDEGLEALERANNWPARSAKLALKLGLAQIALNRSAR